MSKLTVRIPKSRPSEREYILGVILDEFLGLNWQSIAEDRTSVAIEFDGSDAVLLLPDILLATPSEIWLTDASLPAEPLRLWEAGREWPEATLVSQTIPIIYGEPVAHDVASNEIRLPVDILGSCFFMLTRYEEVARPVRDQHDRFPGSGSLAYRAEFLQRPIVNEYVEILWSALKRLAPGLERKSRCGSCFVTCDVDEPYLASSRSLPTLVRQVGGDILKRGSFGAASRRVLGYASSAIGSSRWEPGNTFDWMMDVNERAGNRMAFYFIAEKTVGVLDGSAEIDDPFVLSLMRRIHERGHEIGLHGSYMTYLDPERLLREFTTLRAAMRSAQVEQEDVGGRQHFLRWRTPVTAKALADAGLIYDSTLGYADAPGFRCGTCYSFPLFDLTTGEQLALRERPLIVMESSVIADQYLGLGYGPASFDLMKSLMRRSLLFQGEFVLLWHNSHFMESADRILYSNLIAS